MGYRCPVCGSPQQDDEHLANHLAMTAMLHAEDHEAWLDDRVADWGDYTPPELAAEIVDDAEEIDYDAATAEDAEVEIPTEDGGDHDHDHAGTHPTEEIADPAEVPDSGFIDEAAEQAVAEAREMTRKRRENATDGDDDATGGADDAADGDDA
ncbi:MULTISPECIES: DUF5810 domain-containing protein [Halolamina]|uniref:Uncharacterized protein n=1 Tax=Halolamina pelagica TaxID=699431 RepID=A0A1I5UAK2_9EURY|nr:MULTISPECIES: DUF5810 domain-containing protein [Halolamina]NHX37202.1 hypothetical protein [Halolamina sp. R1-12]SFP92313.1 hypothetical protein SAMN05216277_11229 [Halolamina pelagica]